MKEWGVKINRGILTGCNEAFIIDGATKDKLISEDSKSEEIIRPILRGRDIKRYSYTFADKWIILASYGSHKWIPTQYPAIYSHLCQYEEKLKNRGQCRYTANGKPNTKSNAEFPGQHHWLELDNNPRQNYLDDFSKQKIVWGEFSAYPKFTFVKSGYFFPNNMSMIIAKDSLPILASLNSAVAMYYVANNTPFGMGSFKWYQIYVKEIPIVSLPTQEKRIITRLIEEMLVNDKRNTQKEVDELLFDAYGFTLEEQQHILSFSEEYFSKYHSHRG